MKNELGLSTNSIKAYMGDIADFKRFLGKRLISNDTIDQFIETLKCQGLKPSTIKRKQMSIRCAINNLVSLSKIDKSIVDCMNSVSVQKRNSLEKISEQQFNTILERLDSERSFLDKTIVLLMYESGLRVSEVCGLKKEDISFQKKEIRVFGKGCIERIVPTSQRCLSAVSIYLEKMTDCTSWSLFVSKNDRPLTRHAVGDRIKRIGFKCGIPYLTPHVLRRSCATNLLRNGMNIELVKNLLGHQNIETTEAYIVSDLEYLSQIHAINHPFGDICVAQK